MSENNQEEDHDSGFVPKPYVCVNPLCRRKWKQLNPRSVAIFCPSCKKASEYGFREFQSQQLNKPLNKISDEVNLCDLLEYWLPTYQILSLIHGFPPIKSPAVRLPDDRTSVTYKNIMDYYHDIFPDAPSTVDVRNWSSMGSKKPQLTGTITKDHGNRVLELTVSKTESERSKWDGQSLVNKTKSSHSSPNTTDATESKFTIIDWRNNLKIGDKVQFVAFPNPSVTERHLSAHVLKVLDNRINPPMKTDARMLGRPNVGRRVGKNKPSSFGAADSPPPPPVPSLDPAFAELFSTNNSQSMFGGELREQGISQSPFAELLESVERNKVTYGALGSSNAFDKDSSQTMMDESMLTTDDIDLTEAIQNLFAASEQAIPDTPLMPQKEPLGGLKATAVAPGASPLLTRPSWIPDTPMSPQHLHNDTTKLLTNPLLHLLQQQQQIIQNQQQYLQWVTMYQQQPPPMIMQQQQNQQLHHLVTPSPRQQRRQAQGQQPSLPPTPIHESAEEDQHDHE